MLDGRSLLDQPKANEDPIESLAVLKVIAGKEAQSRRTLKGSGKRPRSLDEVTSEYSSPFYDRS